MSIILGFGSTEEDFEKQEMKFVDEFLKGNFKGKGSGDISFDDKIVNELEKQLKKREKYFHEKDEEYKTAKEYPDRYSTYYFDIVWNVCTLCVAFQFSHTNRRHALSPDGWALLQTRNVYYADIWDYRD